MQLLATAMEINDTRSIIRTLPQQTVVTLPADPDLQVPSTEGQQQQLLSQPSQVRNASTTAQLMQKLGAALPAAVISAQPGAVLPLQGALPYGNVSAGGALSQPATGQLGALIQSQALEAAASANASAAGIASSEAGALLPAQQAWQAYPEHDPSAHNVTMGTELYTSRGAAGEQQVAGVNLTRSGCTPQSPSPASSTTCPAINKHVRCSILYHNGRRVGPAIVSCVWHSIPRAVLRERSGPDYPYDISTL